MSFPVVSAVLASGSAMASVVAIASESEFNATTFLSGGTAFALLAALKWAHSELKKARKERDSLVARVAQLETTLVSLGQALPARMEF